MKNIGDTHGHEGSDFLSVLDKLYTYTFTNGRVWLLSLDADFLEYNALGM